MLLILRLNDCCFRPTYRLLKRNGLYQRIQFTVLLFAVFVPLFSHNLFAQTTSSIQGKCSDFMYKPIVSGVVLYNNPETGRTYTLRTNYRGEYLSLGVTPGKYRVLVYAKPEDQNSGAVLYEIDGYEVRLGENTLNIDRHTAERYGSTASSVRPQHESGEQSASAQANVATATVSGTCIGEAGQALIGAVVEYVDLS